MSKRDKSLLYGLPMYLLKRLQHVQNIAAARLLTFSPKYVHITQMLKELHWLPVHLRVEFNILLITFKALHDCAPVKTTAEYWNLLSKANNPKLRKAIGPLKRQDGSLAVDDKEKSNLVNNFFSNIGEKLADSFQPQYLSHQATSTKIVPCVNNIALSPLAIERKLANLKTNKLVSRYPAAGNCFQKTRYPAVRNFDQFSRNGSFNNSKNIIYLFRNVKRL